MADQSDVSNALVALISSTLYPNGTSEPSPGGNDARVYPGWPLPAQLDADMATKPSVSHLSVFTRPEEHNTTRYDSNEWEEISRNTATVILVASGSLVTIGGAVGGAKNVQNVTVMINGKPYVYQVQSTDTLLSVLLKLADLVAVDYPLVSTQGLTMMLPPNARVSAARVGVTGVIQREVGRQNKLFQITVWASTPAIRVALAKTIIPVLSSTFWLSLADGTRGRLIYKSSTETDEKQRQRIYRRDLFYYVEFATVETMTATEITQQQTIVQASVDGALPAQTVADVYS